MFQMIIFPVLWEAPDELMLNTCDKLKNKVKIKFLTPNIFFKKNKNNNNPEIGWNMPDLTDTWFSQDSQAKNIWSDMIGS